MIESLFIFALEYPGASGVNFEGRRYQQTNEIIPFTRNILPVAGVLQIAY